MAYQPNQVSMNSTGKAFPQKLLSSRATQIVFFLLDLAVGAASFALMYLEFSVRNIGRLTGSILSVFSDHPSSPSRLTPCESTDSFLYYFVKNCDGALAHNWLLLAAILFVIASALLIWSKGMKARMISIVLMLAAAAVVVPYTIYLFNI